MLCHNLHQSPILLPRVFLIYLNIDLRLTQSHSRADPLFTRYFPGVYVNKIRNYEVMSSCFTIYVLERNEKF